MAHFAKYGKAATGHMAKHYERAKEWNPEIGEMEYVKFANQDIDTERTHLNYNLAPERPQGQIGFIKQRMSEIKCQNRADINVMCSCVVTLPRKEPQEIDVNKSEWLIDDVTKEATPTKIVYKDYSEEERQLFFETAYDVLKGKFGEENVISAYVHKDETRDHMHFAFVPAVDDKAWNKKHPEQPRQKLSAKECITQTLLQSFHKDLQAALDKEFGEDFFPVLNGATLGGNKTVAELKATKQIEEIGNQYIVADHELLMAKIELEDVSYNLEKTQRMLKNKEQQLSEINQKVENSQNKLQEIEQAIKDTTEKQDVLVGEIEALIDVREALAEEKEILSEAVANLNITGKKQMSGDEWDRVIAARKEQHSDKKKLEMLEKFVQHPQVAPLLQQWQQLQIQSRGLKKKDELIK